MAHFFEKRDRWGNGFALWVVAGMAFAIPICVWSVRSISPSNKPMESLPADNPQVLANQWCQKQFPHEETVLMSWDGSNLGDARIKTFVESVVGQADADGFRRGGLKQIQLIRTPQELIAQAVKNQIPEAEAVRRLQGTFLGIGSVKLKLTEAGRADKQQTIERLKMVANSRLNKEITVKDGETPAEGTIAVPLVSAKRATGDADSTKEASETPALTPEHDLQVTWKGLAWSAIDLETFQQVAQDLKSNVTTQKPEGELLIERCFLTPGSPVALAVVLSEAGLADPQGTLQLLKDRAVAAGIPEASLHLGGKQVTGVALRGELSKAVWNKAVPAQKLHERSVLLIACVVGLGLSIWMLRSARLIITVMGISYLGVLYAAAFVPVVGGSPSILMLAIPAVLITVTLSGAIHLVNYWKQASLSNPQTALITALKRAQGPNLWAGAAVAIGCASLLSSTLGPIREFGVFSVIGCGISVALVVLGLPALMQIWPAAKPQAVELDETDWRNIGGWLSRYQRILVPVLLVAAVAVEAGLIRSRTEIKPLLQFGDQTRVVQDYNSLEASLGGTSVVDLIVRFDQDAQEELRFVDRAAVVRQIENELGRLSEVSGTLSMAKFLPEFAPLSATANASQKARYSTKSREVEEIAKDETNTSVAGLFAVAKTQTPFNAAGDELWRISARVSSFSPKPYATLTKELDDICCGVLKKIAVHGTEKYHPGGEQVYYHPGASHIIAGTLPLSLATQQELSHGLIIIALLVCGGVGVVMIAMLKNPRAGVLATIPVTLPLAVVYGGMSWAGLALDMGSVAAGACVLGLAASGTVHMVCEFRRQLAQGKSRSEASSAALAQCGPSVWQTSFIVGLGLFVLYSSELQPISRFGWLSASLVLTVLLTDLVLTPSLLAGPLGKLLEEPAAEEVASEQSAHGATSTTAAHGEKHTAAGTVSGAPLPRPHLEPAAVMRVRRVE